MLRHVLGHNLPRRRATIMPSSAAILDPALRRAGQPGAGAALLIERLDELAARERACRCACAITASAFDEAPTARARGDEADAAAGEQSLRDQRGRRAAALRGGLVSREPPAARSDFQVWRDDSRPAGPTMTPTATSTTPSITQWFDSAVNAWLVEAGPARHRSMAIRSGSWSKPAAAISRRWPFRSEVEVGLARRAARPIERPLPARRVRRRRGRSAAAQGRIRPRLVDRDSRRPVEMPDAWRDAAGSDQLAQSRALAAAYSLGEPVDEFGRGTHLDRRADALARAPDVAPRLGLPIRRLPKFIASRSGARRDCRGRARRRRSTRADNCRERR